MTSEVSTADYRAARSDSELLSRFIAQAEMMGIPNAASVVQNNYMTLLNSDVANGSTIAYIYAYAHTSRENYIKATPPPAGVDPAGVLDSYLKTALETLPESQPPASPPAE